MGKTEQIGEILRTQTTHQTTSERAKYDAESVYKLLLNNVMEILSNKGVQLILNDENKNIIGQIALWYANDERFKGSLRKGIALRGNVGTGKTVIIQALEKTIIEIQSNYPAFIHAYELQELYSNKESSDKSEQINSLKNRMFAIIDDVGVECVEVKSFGTLREPFNDIFDYRYRKEKLTIITTNLTPTKIGEIYGTRIKDRFRECMNDLILDGNSLRI